MTIRNIIGLIIIVLMGSMMSCEADHPIKSVVSEERWTLQENNGAYERGEIQFLEKYIYNKDGELEGHIFYDTDRSLKAKELSIFTEDKIQPVGSKFIDAQDSILSIYDFKYHDNQKVSSKAYDALTSELLRIELYDYDDKGNMIQKDILNAQMDTVRTHIFTYDDKGNEAKVQVLNEHKQEILTEIFQIKKYDNEGAWLEKWGFVNDKPFSYRVRTIEYH